MADLYEPDLGTAFYRSNDPIKNLTFKIHLERTTSSNVLAPVDTEETGSEVQLGISRDYEEVQLHWQQKIFSQREVELYHESSSCKNIIEEKYHKDVQSILAKGEPSNRIFTYVDHDDYKHLSEQIQYMTTSAVEKPTNVSERMANIRRRRVAGRKSADNSMIPRLNVVDNAPSDDHKSRHHLLPPPVQTMYIMADLSLKDRPSTLEDEVILCVLQINTSGILSIRPDFNKNRKPYIAETHMRGGDIYDYSIVDTSKTLNSQELDREIKMYKELYVRHTEFLHACVGNEFDVPPPDVLKLIVYGEMESAKNFEYDDLYIHFFVDLPKDWMVGGSHQLSWVTETCRTKIDNLDNVAYFSFPFNFELFHKKIYTEDTQDLISQLPMILIEVLSLDSWSRFRTEGYCYLNLPTNPGKYRKTYNCWRPIGTSLSSEQRRFFIGGSPELEDMSYMVVPCTFQGSHMSKYAFRTETTGSVTMNLNVIMQSRSFMEQKASKKSLSALHDALGVSIVQAKTAQVLEAFKKAHERMLQSQDKASLDLLRDTK